MAAAPHTGRRVLVIDDDIVTQEMMSVLLAGDGYRVAAACNGADALERLRTYEKPDLIVLDLKMPVMDGCAFCQARRQDKELASIPVVVLSAARDVAEQAAALGATVYLQKPVDCVTILNTVRRCCQPEPAGVAVGTL
jgi:CheY-like chemotaxis protein